MDRFHLAFPVYDLGAAKKFYVDGLGCTLGRENRQAIVLGLYGHQLVARREQSVFPLAQVGIYPRHFGIVFETFEAWAALVKRARDHNLEFYKQPEMRFKGRDAEHHTFFLRDPSGNLLEFKYYTNEGAILGICETEEIGDKVD